MSQSSKIEQSSQNQPLTAMPFNGAQPDSMSSQTVVNPEGRQPVLPMPAVPHPRSSICNRLFPPPDAEPISDSGFQPLEGIQLAHFKVEERIGSGGMGAVFRFALRL